MQILVNLLYEHIIHRQNRKYSGHYWFIESKFVVLFSTFFQKNRTALTCSVTLASTHILLYKEYIYEIFNQGMV